MKVKSFKSMGKKIVAVALAATMALSLAACGNGGDNSDAGSAGKVENKGETYELVVSLTQSAEAAHTKMFKEELVKLEEQSGGQLKFTVYDSGTLAKITDAYDAAKNGMSDIIFTPNSMGYDTIPINGRLLTLPMMGYTSEDQAYAVYNQLREEFPEIDAECEADGLVNLGVWFNGPTHLHLNKSVNVTSVDNLKGMKLGGADAQQNELINGMGATGVFVSSADAYTSLDNGVVDGIVQHTLFFRVTGATDIVKTVVEFGDTGIMRGCSMMLMNKDKYDTLPEDLQVMIKDAFADMMVKAQEIESNDIATVKQQMADNGAEYITLSAADCAPIKAQADQMHKDTIKELEEKGINAQAIYDRAQELISTVE